MFKSVAGAVSGTGGLGGGGSDTTTVDSPSDSTTNTGAVQSPGYGFGFLPSFNPSSFALPSVNPTQLSGNPSAREAA
jgi:hypothetical protein